MVSNSKIKISDGLTAFRIRILNGKHFIVLIASVMFQRISSTNCTHKQCAVDRLALKTT